MKKSWFLIGFVAVITLSLLQRGANGFTELVVFGDSHSDTGNWAPDGTWGLHPAYLVGRFSNGPVWVEHFATQLGLSPPTPSGNGGLNFAWGGARTGYGYDEDFGVSYPRIESQVEEYLADHLPGEEQLLSIFIGHNDFGFFAQDDISIPASSIADSISMLVAAGGKNFLVPTLHPLGDLPAYRGGTREAELNSLTNEFNSLLDVQLNQLQSSLGVSIYRPDLHALIQDAVQDPTSYGLTNVSDRAFSRRTTVPNPGEYMYWDSDHFTTSFYKTIAEFALLSLPLESRGDFDVDGDIDGADFLVWQRGESPHPLSSTDLFNWQLSFGVSNSLSGAKTVVPETAAWIMMVMGSGLFVWDGGKRHHRV